MATLNRAQRNQEARQPSQHTITPREKLFQVELLRAAGLLSQGFLDEGMRRSQIEIFGANGAGSPVIRSIVQMGGGYRFMQDGSMSNGFIEYWDGGIVKPEDAVKTQGWSRRYAYDNPSLSSEDNMEVRRRANILKEELNRDFPDRNIIAHPENITPSDVFPFLQQRLQENQILEQRDNVKHPFYVFDVCDSMSVKAKIHLAAQQLGVPVAMPTDVARANIMFWYDYRKPGKELFNGLVNEQRVQEVSRMDPTRVELSMRERAEIVQSLINFTFEIVPMKYIPSSFLNAYRLRFEEYLRGNNHSLSSFMSIVYFPQLFIAGTVGGATSAGLIEYDQAGGDIPNAGIVNTETGYKTPLALLNERMIQRPIAIKELRKTMDTALSTLVRASS